jgi:cholesterol oxidase
MALMPYLFFGIMKMSIFRHVVIISGTGVVVLVYANTLPIPKTNFINQEAGVNSRIGKQLKPFYQQALKMLGAF